MLISKEEMIARIKAYLVQEASTQKYVSTPEETAILDGLDTGESVAFGGKSYCAGGNEGFLQVSDLTVLD